MFATKEGRVKRSRLEEYVRINRNGKYAIKLATETDMLVGVRLLTKEDHVLLVTERAMAVRFHPAEQKEKVDKDTGEVSLSDTVRVQGRISQGVAGINLNEGDHVVGLIVAADIETTILTITRNGMAKRSRLGDGEMHPAFDESGVRKIGKDGEPGFERDGYRRSNRGTKGVRTMNLDDDDGIVVVRQVADLADQLFLLTEKGMMMRMPAHQSKETKGGCPRDAPDRLRNATKDGYADQVIFAARLPAGPWTTTKRNETAVVPPTPSNPPAGWRKHRVARRRREVKAWMKHVSFTIGTFLTVSFHAMPAVILTRFGLTTRPCVTACKAPPR